MTFHDLMPQFLDSAAQLAELEMGQSPESQSDISEAGSLTCGWL